MCAVCVMLQHTVVSCSGLIDVFVNVYNVETERREMFVYYLTQILSLDASCYLNALTLLCSAGPGK